MLPSWDFEALGLSQNNANELLLSASVQEALVRHRHEKWVHEISETCLTMLDLCETTKDVLLLIKSHLQVLRSKNKRQFVKEHKNAAHSFSKLEKEMLKCLKSLRGLKNKPVGGDIADVCRDSVLVVVDMLGDLRTTCILVLEWTLDFISYSSRGSSLRWSMLLCGKGKVMSEEVAKEAGERRVEALEMVGEELECTFRRLIQARVSLLNILTNN